MTSKTIVLRVFDGTIVAVTGILILSIAGLPLDWLADLIDLSSCVFCAFAMFFVLSASWLMHAIATSDPAR